MKKIALALVVAAALCLAAEESHSNRVVAEILANADKIKALEAAGRTREPSVLERWQCSRKGALLALRRRRWFARTFPLHAVGLPRTTSITMI